MKKVESSQDLAPPIKTLQFALGRVPWHHTVETISSIIPFLPSRNSLLDDQISYKFQSFVSRFLSPAAERSARDDPPTSIYSPSTSRFRLTQITPMNNPSKLVIREFHRRPVNVAIFLNLAAEVDVTMYRRCIESRVRRGRWKEVDSVEAEVLSRRCRGGEKGWLRE